LKAFTLVGGLVRKPISIRQGLIINVVGIIQLLQLLRILYRLLELKELEMPITLIISLCWIDGMEWYRWWRR